MAPVLESEKKYPSAAESAALREKHVIQLPAPMYARPVQIVKGQRQYVWDETGKKYLDAFAGVATVSIGHSHPHWLGAIKAQMDDYFHTPALYLHPSLGQFAQRLVKKLQAANPELECVFFTNSGSEANDLASLIAKNATGVSDYVALRHAYHGRTLMTMALTGQHTWRHSLPYGQSVHFAKTNYTYRGVGWQEAVADLEDLIRTSTGGKIAAFFAEPINGVGGAITPEPEYFKAAYEVVKKHGGLFVADEVQTGVGRTGSHFLGIQNWGVKPDIVTMAKGLANGYPIGAVITTRKIADSMKGKLHYNTFGGGPVQMAAANATLDVIETESLQENARLVGSHLIAALKAIPDGRVGEVRGMGLMIGVELVKDAQTKEPNAELAVKVLEATKDAGVLIGKGGLSGNVLRIKPPLCITAGDADTIAGSIEEALKKA